MIHTLAFAETSGGASADLLLDGVSDPIFSRSVAANFQIPTNHNLIALYGGAATALRFRINDGSLRAAGLPQIIPFNTTLLPANDPNLCDLRDRNLMLKGGEDFRIDYSTSGAAENVYACAWISDIVPNYNIPIRDCRWLRFTATVTAVALAYSNATTIVLDDVLDGGVYNVYGLQTQGANIVLSRLLFQGQTYRPGCLGQAALGSRSHDMFRGGMGLWGQFNTYSLPQIETLENAAGASSIVGWIYCAKAG
jgi:hypothetical protein